MCSTACALRALLQVDERNHQVRAAGAPEAAGDAVHGEHVLTGLGGVQRGVAGRRRVPARGTGRRHHADRVGAVPFRQPDAHVRLAASTGFGAAVVGVQDLAPGLPGEGASVGAPLAHSPAVPVADAAHDEGDHLVVAGGRRLDRRRSASRSGRAGCSRARRRLSQARTVTIRHAFVTSQLLIGIRSPTLNRASNEVPDDHPLDHVPDHVPPGSRRPPTRRRGRSSGHRSVP